MLGVDGIIFRLEILERNRFGRGDEFSFVGFGVIRREMRLGDREKGVDFI